jgi:diguanylate cyclase (GGDEF)-like protein/PAS domain S-box-containing protein
MGEASGSGVFAQQNVRARAADRNSPSIVDWRAAVENAQRLSVLRATQLLDTAAEEGFDHFARLSARVLEMPTALVSLVDVDRQFFKAAYGLAEPWASKRETPLSHSFCKYAVASGEPLLVDDARESSVLKSNLAVSELGVVAYAGIPLVAAGQTIGALCVIDSQPHTWTDEERELLREIASAVEAQVQLRLANATLYERSHLLDGILTLMPAGVLLRDASGKVLRTNPALERMLGRSEHELENTDFEAITHPDDVQADTQARQQLLLDEQTLVGRLTRYRHARGHYIGVRQSASVLADGAGKQLGTIAVIEDVTHEREADETKSRQSRIYHAIARSIPRGAVLMFDRYLRYIAADGPELFASLGVGKEDIEGRTAGETARPENRERVERAYRQALAGESSEFEAERKGRVLLTRVAPVWDGDVVVAGMALLQDVTEERQHAAALAHAKALFEATMSNIRDGVVVLDANRRVLLANRAYADLLGFDQNTLVGSTRDQLLAHVGTMVEHPSSFAERIEKPSPSVFGGSDEFVLVRPVRKILRRTITPIDLPDGQGSLIVWQDITIERELSAERERQAFTDPLTGVANRRAAEQVLKKELARVQRGGTRLSVALFDVDHFKRVNDEFGHNVGDEVLRRIARTLESATRLTDSVARWGGEEFLAILPVSLEGAVAFCERVRGAVERLVCPGVGHVTISVGVAQLQPNETSEVMIERADQRLYAAKLGGRNRVCS